MKKMFFTTCIFFALLCTNSFAWDYLYVQDPRGWSSAQGTIEEAVLSVNPQGIYMDMGLYLTFSAKNNWYNFTHNDTLEVIYNFDLPQGAIVHDLWLWVGNDIMKALIMDKWTASSIYENIVKRRRDPAILFKKSSTSYELRIFPMAGDETRKIKLSYLVPAQWGINSVSAPVPVNLLTTSYTPLSKLDLIFKPSSTWKAGRIAEYSDIKFETSTDTLYRDYQVAMVPGDKLNGNLSFEADGLLKEGIFVSNLQKGSEGIYQFAMLPDKCLGLNASKKVAILIDYDASKGDINTQSILGSIKSTLKSSFSEKDSFNLFFSRLNVIMVSDKWLPGDSATIEAVFDTLTPAHIANYSFLPPLLTKAIEFINEHGRDASILLISNSEQYGDYQTANPLINDLKEKMEIVYPIYVVDFLQNPQTYHYINNRSYSGNEYFFSNLSQITYGEYIRKDYSNTVASLITKMIQSVSGFISSFDLYTTLQSGFCFGRFSLDESNAMYLNKPILQVGKYNGSFPFIIQASGVYKSNLFSKNITIQASEALPADTLLETIWAGNYIRTLEAQTQTNNIISEIVDYSVSQRVLSLYSAFIALEPSDSINVCYDCLDESDIISVEEDGSIPEDITIGAYPNPFNAQVTLKVTIPAKFNGKNLTFKVYNILGEVVKTFYAELNTSGIYEFQWNGTNDYGETVSSGIYLFVVQTAEKNITHKIVLMK